MFSRFNTSAQAVTALLILAVTTDPAEPQDMVWQHTRSVKGFQQCYSIHETRDGGAILGGWACSCAGNMYLEKITSDGDVQWWTCLGGSCDDYCEAVIPVNEGGYIMAGWSFIFPVDCYQMCLLKVDDMGELEWKKTYGKDTTTYCFSAQQTSDSGFILGGSRWNPLQAAYNVYIVKTDPDGNTVWDKSYGGTGNDGCFSLQQTSDGGFILAGDTDSYSLGCATCDMYLIKVDSQGNLEWFRTFGGKGIDGCYSVRQTSDGGYILAGDSNSFSSSPFDFYLVKTDARGNLEWQRTYGGGGWDNCHAVRQTADGGYYLAGYSDSFGTGDFDMYVLKIDSRGLVQWDKRIGSEVNEYAHSLIISEDDCLIVGGYTESSGDNNDDVLVVKVKDKLDYYSDEQSHKARSRNLPSYFLGVQNLAE